MSEPKNGGPAFPYTSPDGMWGNKGMTLRDWFAGQAIAGAAKYDPATTAQNAYVIADAMLAEREKNGHS
jgi:hypothetical protein